MEGGGAPGRVDGIVGDVVGETAAGRGCAGGDDADVLPAEVIDLLHGGKECLELCCVCQDVSVDYSESCEKS